MTGQGRPITMLMVDDNSADVFFFREALDETGLQAVLHVVTDGVAAIDFLCRTGGFSDAPRPDVVVLDLNLPIMNGREFLVKMMSHPEFLSIPVAIMTTSRSESGMCSMCPPGMCVYFTKTDDFHQLKEIIRQIVQHAESKLL